MERHKISPRNNWQSELEKLGFGYHSLDNKYWDESIYYSFNIDEINEIEKATNEIYEMCLKAVEHVISNNMFDLFHIPDHMINHIKYTWENDSPAIYGRFDLAYKDGQIKMLEFNADTPTSLYEASVIQWYWLQDKIKSDNKEYDQFNSIHEKIIEYFKYLRPYLNSNILHFACIKDSLEDLSTVEYMRDCAIQAGYDTKFIYIDDIGYDSSIASFVDMDNNIITDIFKLYPYEWMVNEDFGYNLAYTRNINWIEPSWKMILSNKAILPVLTELFPDNKYLLKSYFNKPDWMKSYAKKPLLSREGANILLIKDESILDNTDGEYGEEGYIYQELFELPSYDKNYPLIGSWIIGQESAGIGIRESYSLITDNKSRFIPHLIK